MLRKLRKKLECLELEKKSKMPPKTAPICKNCKASFIPYTPIQRATKTCGECIKEKAKQALRRLRDSLT